jgi:hypothetical protein
MVRSQSSARGPSRSPVTVTLRTRGSFHSARNERARGVSRCRWSSHRPEPRSVRDAQLTEVDESESVVQGCAALGAGFEIRGHALPVAAVERGAQQRRPKALTLEACGDTQVAN